MDDLSKSDLRSLLNEARKEVKHYRWTAKKAAKRGLRESEQLSLVIAQRKKAEADLKEVQDELKALVVERTAEFSRATYFVKVFAHDIKNILFANAVGLDLAMKRPPKIEEIQRLADTNKHIMRMITNLINVFSKNEIVLRKTDVPITDIFKTAIKNWKTIFSNKNIHLIAHISYVESVSVDVEYMELVWNNLFTNAYEHTPKDGTVNIKLYPADNLVNFSFSNTGKLIPKEYRGELFDKYFTQKVHTAYNKGLGLNYSKMMCELHSGKLIYDVNTDGMNEFIIQMPL